MTSNPITGGPGGVPYTRGMWRGFQTQMGTLAEAERREEEKPVEQKADETDQIMRDLRHIGNATNFFKETNAAAALIERLSVERDELRAADRDHLAATRGMEKRLTKRAEAAEKERDALKQMYEDCTAKLWGAETKLHAAEARLTEAVEVIKPFALLCDLEVRKEDGDLTSVFPMVAAGRLRAAKAFLNPAKEPSNG